MGCAASGVNRTIMMFNRHAHNSSEYRAILDRKLYIAKESPEPEFDLSGCDLRHLPSGIFSICKVFRKEYLYLQNNKLKTLEEGGQLADLQLVKTLNISKNNFTQIPKSIRFLLCLTELYLQENQITYLPDEIKFLQTLKILDVSRNNLKKLNPVLGQLQSLRKLIIIGNKDLTEICIELCLASNLCSIELDCAQFYIPPPEVTIRGTEAIMKFLCLQANITYNPPVPENDNILPAYGGNQSVHLFTKPRITWEEAEQAVQQKEDQIYKANQVQREKILSNVLKEQLSLDIEISKIHEGRELERQKLINTIQKEEQNIECLINNFIGYDKLKPEIIQQQLAHEQLEHDHLLEITRQNYDNIKKSDILKTMQQLLEENCSVGKYMKYYKDNLNDVKKNLLMKETEVDEKLEQLLNAKDQLREGQVQLLLEDQDVQKAMVSSLLDQVDARSWSLNQEISLVSSHLAKLSVIEQEKRKINIVDNYNELLEQRIHLVSLLEDLFIQKNKRRKQLIDTLHEAENASNNKTDFWLQSYKKLLDCAPPSLLSMGKSLDPVLVNYLLQEGVIHCLPFLVNILFSDTSYLNITTQDLKLSGVCLKMDQENIIKAINKYLVSKNGNELTSSNTSAPTLPADDSQIGVLSQIENNISPDGECVICMECKSQVVFVPCGHMCCCQSCSQKDISICPMCRSNIERIIKVLIA
ncbi:E3 ubiquitin-protein ligase LRSAM1-like [Pieris rapae]|uniref:E3 ubiquitin-protein ligase LRSAM1-like n=1 Tax=Pieris rapae TaxID=64459 RepID=UPI001E280CB3|nr:E3 ubiquitin-protein ligase LRSAM1-like [Pieris rapae]